MTDRLSPQHEAEIRERIATRTAAFTESINRNSPFEGQNEAQRAEAVLEEDVPALLAELAAVRAERDRYRTAWQSASFRAEARGEGIERIVKDRESYLGWLKQEQAATQLLRDRIAELEALKPAPIQTCRVCSSGYIYGEPCGTCEFNARMARETGGAQ